MLKFFRVCGVLVCGVVGVTFLLRYLNRDKYTNLTDLYNWRADIWS
jgi:hypothetical protein